MTPENVLLDPQPGDWVEFTWHRIGGREETMEGEVLGELGADEWYPDAYDVRDSLGWSRSVRQSNITRILP